MCMWNKVLHSYYPYRDATPQSPPSPVLLFIHLANFAVSFKLLEKIFQKIQKVTFSIQLAEQRGDYNSCPDIL